jgi:aryl-alcohol dehydrogenase-like predicted oxidoreductase
MERREFLKKFVYLASAAGLTSMGNNRSLLAFEKSLKDNKITNSNNETRKDRIGKTLPLRRLGSTEEKVTMLGLGGYHIGWTTEHNAQETIEAALEGGIRFFDTAESYGGGRSEERYGKYLIPKYRDIVFIMTKTLARDVKTAKDHLEGSLHRLKTDYIDLWQIHAVETRDDADIRFKNGVVDFMLDVKRSGKVRYIGFTGHRDPAAHQRVLELAGRSVNLNTCQMPINLIDISYHSFTLNVMPILLDREIGILAMKSLSDGRFFSKKVVAGKLRWETKEPVIPDRVSIKEALYFVWSLPVSVLITGAENAKLVREKIELAKAFTPVSEEQLEKLISKVADQAKEGKFEYYKKV